MNQATVLPARLTAWRDPAIWSKTSDIVAVLLALSLPWSTSLVGIFGVIFVLTVAPTIDRQAFAASLRRPLSALPIALFALALVGTLWSDAPWGVRSYAIGPLAKFLVLPLLVYHFERSARGMWVFVAFVVSCAVLMLVSWIVAFDPGLSLKSSSRGIFVKNYIDQSQEFTLCAVALAYPILRLLQAGKVRLATFLCAVSLGFVVNMTFVIVSRTAMVTMPIMLVVFALLHLKWRTSLMTFAAMLLLAGMAWMASPQLRHKAEAFVSEYQEYKTQNLPSSVGLRLEFWRKSLNFLFSRR